MANGAQRLISLWGNSSSISLHQFWLFLIFYENRYFLSKMIKGIAFSACFSLVLYQAHAQEFLPQRETKTKTGGYFNIYLAVFDFDNDGFDDLLLGGNNGATLDKTPVVIMINQRDGTFVERTSHFITGDVRAACPISTIADYNKDGTPDFALFDQGNLERGQAPEGGFYGEETQLLISTSRTHWIRSTHLADVYQQAHPENRRDLHCKYPTSADIDNDGDVDILAEAGGGYKTILTHFYVNDGTGHFRVDKVGTRLAQDLIHGGQQHNYRWRYQVHNFTDMNNDGFKDLVMGQLRRIDNSQEHLYSLVMLNDGMGNFPTQDSIRLPWPTWNEGYTYTKKILTPDFDNDSFADIIISHERGGNSILNNGNAGNYFQFIRNNGNSTFTDVTSSYIAVPEAVLSSTSAYGVNGNTSKSTMLTDINMDDFPDIVIAGVGSPVGPHNPFIFLNDGEYFFKAIDPNRITKGAEWFGEDSYPIDINNDGLLDLISSDLTPGPDGVYGTGDEFSEIFPIYGVRDFPVMSNVVTTNCAIKVGGLHPIFIPDLGISYFRITNISGGKLYRKDNEQEVPNNSFLPRTVVETGLLFTPEGSFHGQAFFKIQGATGPASVNLVGSAFTTDIVVIKSTLEGHAGKDVEKCQSESVTLGVAEVEGFTYRWTPSTGLSEATAASPMLTLTQSAGQYTYEITASREGCTSTDKVIVTILPKPDKPTISQDKETLTASIEGVAYEWQNNENLMVGSVARSISVNESGIYSVRVKNNKGCTSDWSDDFHAVYTAIENWGRNLAVIFPNPVKGHFIIEGDFDSGNIKIDILDTTGRLLSEWEAATLDRRMEIDVKKIPDGLYLVRLQFDGRALYRKVFIQN
jgi:hypothetical protein